MNLDEMSGRLTLEPATIADARYAADVWTAAHPDDPIGGADKQYSWAKASPELEWRRFVVLEGGSRIGYAMAGVPFPDQPRGDAWLEFELEPTRRAKSMLAATLGAIEAEAKSSTVTHLRVHAFDDDTIRQEIVHAAAYGPAGAEVIRALDLRAHREHLWRMRDETRVRMREQGIELTTLERLDGGDVVPRMYECFREALADAPDPGAQIVPPLEWYEEYLAAPYVHRDRVWVALIEGEVVGESELTYPIERGHVWTAWTGVARRARGRGIALALKVESLTQAADLGIERVRTDNDAGNERMIAINEALGFRAVQSVLRFRKPVAPAQ